MVSCGYETTAVIDGFGSVKGFLAMARGNFRLYPDRHALKLLEQAAPSGPSRLVQIAEPAPSLEETRA
jgi:hypothetical protein